MSPLTPLENLSRPGGALKSEPPDKAEIAATIASYNMVSRFLVGLHFE